MKIFFFFFWIWKTWLFKRNLKFWIFLKIFFYYFFFLKKFGNPKFFLKELKILIDDFFLKNLEILNFFKELKILIFFFLEINLRSTSLMPLVPRPFLKILSFFFFLKICSLSKKSEKDEDDDGVKVMKIYSWWIFFFFEKPILWMRITLAGSRCGLLDKSLLNSCKKIISISNGFIHWNELEVLTQCP